MKSFLDHVRYKIQAFMQGRYGMDELSYFLSMTGLTLFLLSVLIRPLSILYFPALAVLIWSWFRSFSKNIYKRREERNAYLEFRRRGERNRTVIRSMWRDRKTHRYYKCPNCGAIVRIPKPAKGRNIEITCHRCRHSFRKRT